MMMREVEESAVVAMQTWTILISISHHRAHVVVQHFTRHATKEAERMLVAIQQRLQLLVVDEFDVSRAAPAKRSDKHREPVAAAPDGREVCLHLSPGIGFEPNHRLRVDHWSQRREMILQGTVAARIAKPC